MNEEKVCSQIEAMIGALISEKEHFFKLCKEYAGAAAIRVVEFPGDDYRPTLYTEDHRRDIEKWQAKIPCLEEFAEDLRRVRRMLQKELQEEEREERDEFEI